MTIRDLKTNVDASPSLAPAVRNATATGSAIDLRGFDAASVIVHFGAYTDGTHTPSLEASTDGVSYAAVAAGDMAGSFAAVASGAGANTVQQVGYIGTGRYLRPKLTVAGATTGAATAIAVLRGRGARQGV
ncbi:hypothetical protein [Zavarzinia aquatilis]|uniref:Uncharacterized protein n=1 Tax=Zavarzinia aquatilis TaxID=2211142 RepID=A0A317E6T6_9PROT|nr:hypothetical protein [Zavarzinia aquatilis]PWR22747.1 hypothetical protein DKG74_09935 [Zavarzinia aquatilis]